MLIAIRATSAFARCADQAPMEKKAKHSETWEA